MRKDTNVAFMTETCGKGPGETIWLSVTAVPFEGAKTTIVSRMPGKAEIDQ